MWNERYDQPDYLFGTAPAAFLTRHAALLPPGAEVLAVADGEGRNSVWLAGWGHHVTAFDSSNIGVEKARALAAARGYEVAFHEADIFDWEWDAKLYDAVVAVFIQFMGPERRKPVFDGMIRALKPGGILMLHGYAPRQVDYGTGGPGLAENMYTLDQLGQDFAGLDIVYQADYDADLAEGAGHAGKSGLIDFIARMPG